PATNSVGHCLSAGRRALPLKIPLPYRMCVHKPLRMKNFHGVSAGNVHEYLLKSRIGKVSVFHYTPKHASWMNQIEMWFSILVRKLLKRASFTSVEDLQNQVLAFIEYFNATMAKPFKWTYGRQPLSV